MGISTIFQRPLKAGQCLLFGLCKGAVKQFRKQEYDIDVWELQRLMRTLLQHRVFLSNDRCKFSYSLWRWMMHFVFEIRLVKRNISDVVLSVKSLNGVCDGNLWKKKKNVSIFTGIVAPWFMFQPCHWLTDWLITHQLIEAERHIYASINLPSLLQIMACRLVGAKPLSEPMLEYW